MHITPVHYNDNHTTVLGLVLFVLAIVVGLICII